MSVSEKSLIKADQRLTQQLSADTVLAYLPDKYMMSPINLYVHWLTKRVITEKTLICCSGRKRQGYMNM